ncbi:hypothetical protein [Agriterribacter sp.]|uniref:hypothetical protein n=1 Tax=Agriterribacter sp. TaxID=2821509 RepID=UPI002CC45702|nr:hypothetical protein [Agriterribacter sp.]HRO45252.1 hypothetical protein [Agriterribacter sp.]HRQ16855.1 hypothetical protein [Agriterribacter sp.]
MKKNFHSIIMLLSLIALCIALHHTLHAGTEPEKDQAGKERLILSPAAQAFPSAFFIGLE